MKNLLLCGVIGALLVSPNGAFASDDLSSLLGEFANLHVQSTPVKKSAVAKMDVLSPTVESTVSMFVKSRTDLEEAKVNLEKLNQELTTSKENLQNQIESAKNLTEELSSAKTTIDQVQQQKKALADQVQGLKSVQDAIIAKYKELAQNSIGVEASVALKMKLVDALMGIKGAFSSEIRGGDDIVLLEKFKLERASAMVLSSLDFSDGRSEMGLKDDVYAGELRTFSDAKMSRTGYPDLSEAMTQELARVLKSMIAAGVKPLENRGGAAALLTDD